VEAGTPAASASAGSHAEPILVSVNGEDLTNTDVTQRYRELEQAIARLDSDGIWRLRSGANAQRVQVLVDAVDDTLIVQRAKQLGYTPADDHDRFQSLLDMVKKHATDKNDATWPAFLKRDHMTMVEFRRKLERELTLMHMRWSAEAASAFTEDNERKYFEAHLNEFPLMSFEQARELIDQHVVDGLEQARWDKYLATLRSRAVIQWKRADLSRTYAEGLAQQANARH
jgi:SurA N-terminal domain